MLQFPPRDRHGFVNAGSSSVKFQVFAIEGEGRLRRQIKGQIDGIGSRRQLRGLLVEVREVLDRINVDFKHFRFCHTASN